MDASLLAGAMMWVVDEFFIRAAHRGILYHHMDFLADWLDRKGGRDGSETRGADER